MLVLNRNNLPPWDSNVKTIDFDKRTYKQFKRAYQIAEKAHRDTFTFNNQIYLREYAKYVLEYLETEFTEKN